MIADAAAAALKGLNPCSAIPELKLSVGGVAKITPSNIGDAGVAALTEIVAPKVIYNRITKPIQGKFNIATPNIFVGNKLEANKMSNVKFTEDGVAYIESGGLKISLLIDDNGDYIKEDALGNPLGN